MLFRSTITLQTSFTAPHQFDNLLAALIVCDALGVEIRDGRLDVDFSPLREEEHELAHGVLLLNDSYNANPVSMRAALENAAGRAAGRRVFAVLGTMAELGTDSVRYHREIGEHVAQFGVGQLIAVGEAARDYDTGAVPTTWFPTAAEAAEAIPDMVEPHDVVLVKGSRSVGLEAVAAKLRGE